MGIKIGSDEGEPISGRSCALVNPTELTKALWEAAARWSSPDFVSQIVQFVAA